MVRSMRKSVNVGSLRHRIDIGRYVHCKNKWGDPGPKTWQSVRRLWVSVEGLRGNQYFRAQQSVDRSDHRIISRYTTCIEPGMIVRHDGRELTITAVLDETGERRWLTLYCREERPS